MKRTLTQLLLLVVFAAASVHATTPLSIGDVTLYSTGGPCWDDTLLVPTPIFMSGSFTLNSVTGTGTVASAEATVVNNACLGCGPHFRYTYSLDLSAMSTRASHCVKLLIHFGPPALCTYDVMVLTNGSGSVDPSSATLAGFGDINFLFGSGCLLPGQTATTFTMLSDSQPHTSSVTIIDDYIDPVSGHTNESRINVTAIVPDIPPNWAYAPFLFAPALFQGILYTNPVPPLPTTNGPYSFILQLMDAPSNGLPVSPTVTQTVQVVNGLFNTPLPFDPSSFYGGPTWLSIGVKSAQDPGPINFLAPALPLTPTPQAIYAYSAGVVADIAPGQAVTSLNGLTGDVLLQAGYGIVLNTSSNTITISAGAAPPPAQGLSQTSNVKDAVIRQQAAQIADLKARVEKLEQLINSKSGVAR